MQENFLYGEMQLNDAPQILLSRKDSRIFCTQQLLTCRKWGVSPFYASHASKRRLLVFSASKKLVCLEGKPAPLLI